MTTRVETWQGHNIRFVLKMMNGGQFSVMFVKRLELIQWLHL